MLRTNTRTCARTHERTSAHNKRGSNICSFHTRFRQECTRVRKLKEITEIDRYLQIKINFNSCFVGYKTVKIVFIREYSLFLLEGKI